MSDRKLTVNLTGRPYRHYSEVQLLDLAKDVVEHAFPGVFTFEFTPERDPRPWKIVDNGEVVAEYADQAEADDAWGDVYSAPRYLLINSEDK